MKIKLARQKHTNYPNPRCSEVQWLQSLPFLKNPRGYLVHRVRFASTYLWDGERSHDTCTYWCGNVGRGDFCDDPGELLVCARCEAMAVANGEKTTDELCGRHVHLGRLIARRICCVDEDNQGNSSLKLSADIAEIQCDPGRRGGWQRDPLTDSSVQLYYFAWGRMPWHARVLWYFVPFFRSWGQKMPDFQAEEATLERIVRGLTEYDERIDDAVASENFPLAWHELYRLKAFLDGELG